MNINIVVVIVIESEFWICIFIVVIIFFKIIVRIRYLINCFVVNIICGGIIVVNYY